MTKFKIYRAIAIVFFLVTLTVTFLVTHASEIWDRIRVAGTMLTVMLFFVCYALLMSIFNYFEEPGWKNVTIIIFLSGNMVFYVLSFPRPISNPFYNFYILIFYLPFIFAFVTVSVRGIKSLAQSFAYLTLVICCLHILLPFIQGKIDLAAYSYYLNAIFLLPSFMIILLFHRMTILSGPGNEPELSDEEKHDLL